MTRYLIAEADIAYLQLYALYVQTCIMKNKMPLDYNEYMKERDKANVQKHNT